MVKWLYVKNLLSGQVLTWPFPKMMYLGAMRSFNPMGPLHEVLIADSHFGSQSEFIAIAETGGRIDEAAAESTSLMKRIPRV